MPKFTVTVHHFRKPDCLKPEEPTLLLALQHLKFTQIEKIRVGGCFVLTVKDVADPQAAEAVVKATCDQLLVSPVTDYYAVKSIVVVAEKAEAPEENQERKSG